MEYVLDTGAMLSLIKLPYSQAAISLPFVLLIRSARPPWTYPIIARRLVHSLAARFSSGLQTDFTWARKELSRAEWSRAGQSRSEPSQ